jgi:hypothetical protein
MTRPVQELETIKFHGFDTLEFEMKKRLSDGWRVITCQVVPYDKAFYSFAAFIVWEKYGT